MFFRLGQLVARRWPWVIVFWVVVVVGLRWMAPGWDDVTHDGDLAYLPDRAPSVRGELLLERAFPDHHAKSQFVVVLSREDGPLQAADLRMGYDIARRLKNLHGAILLRAARRHQLRSVDRSVVSEAERAWRQRRFQELLEDAQRALDEAVEFDQSLVGGTNGDDSHESLAEIYWNRALAAELSGDFEEAKRSRQRALLFAPQLAQLGLQVAPELIVDLPVLDVWTWRDRVFGRKLISRDHHARLIVVRIANEFLALRNQPLLGRIEAELAEVRRSHHRSLEARVPSQRVHQVHGGGPGRGKRSGGAEVGAAVSRTSSLGSSGAAEVTLNVSGSAAVGGDMLVSARESIEDTELFTVLLIVLILAFVYRAPLLVFIPLFSIVVALLASTSLVAILAAWSEQAGPDSWWHFKVFTTTKIFIVVILYGAGTDYCLFLISRYREELGRSGSREEATSRALAGVGDALAASALTTIFGLSMMYFSEFGKLRFSGPVIGFCLATGLVVCLTLTPALLHGCGRWVFWPRTLPGGGSRGRENHREVTEGSGDRAGDERTADGPRVSRAPVDSRPGGSPVWTWLAEWVVRRPGIVLIGSLVLLLPLVPRGWSASERVTYDVLSALDPARPSRMGAAAMQRHFPIGESGPLTIVLHQPQADFQSPQGRQALTDLSAELYQIEGVRQVRSLIDPLGQYPPGTLIGLTNRQAWRTWLARSHRQTSALYLAQTSEFPRDLTRLDVILEHDPFSRESLDVMQRLDQALTDYCRPGSKFLAGCQIAYSGPTAAVRDLREVTQTDQRRIQWLVILAVYVVLVLILRRPGTCLFLILSVLLTYFVTIGITEAVFSWAHGASYTGLDWKVPLFLFVILVAVGQDYNVYLVTRVIEEQRVLGPMAGLREALIRTGGIITSCGVIMAGTFFSMTSVVWGGFVPNWLPQLQRMLSSSGGLKGMVELGFALALGVLLDTFLVRPILVPSFLALLDRLPLRQKPAIQSE